MSGWEIIWVDGWMGEWTATVSGWAVGSLNEWVNKWVAG
jgi:hypothetical protein